MTNEYDYVYAIIRVDDYHGPDCPTELKVTVKKVVRDEATARQEVERLNALGKAEVRYFSQVTRLEKAPVAAPAAKGTSGPPNVRLGAATVPARRGGEAVSVSRAMEVLAPTLAG